MLSADRVILNSGAAVSNQFKTSSENGNDDLLENLDQKPLDERLDPAELINSKAKHRFECISCGYVYEPDDGVKKLGIEKGTPFLSIDPDKFRCPVCRARTGAFKDIGPRDKPSGFEENLNYGFGANSLTPGQKNVLIFGGLALAVSFFLSLYSLR